MVLEIARLVLQSALLGCALVAVGYARAIHAEAARRLALLDGQDLDQRRASAEDARARGAWQKEVGGALRDMRALLGKLYALAAERSPHERDTRVMPPPAPPRRAFSAVPMPEDDRPSDSDAETRCMDKGLALAALAAAKAPSSPPETLHDSSRE